MMRFRSLEKESWIFIGSGGSRPHDELHTDRLMLKEESLGPGR